jgi:hypothetical protein
MALVILFFKKSVLKLTDGTVYDGAALLTVHLEYSNEE